MKRISIILAMAATLAACGGPAQPQMVQQCGIDPATQQQHCVMVPAQQAQSGGGSNGALWGLGGFLMGRATAPDNRTVVVQQPQPQPQYYPNQPQYQQPQYQQQAPAGNYPGKVATQPPGATTVAPAPQFVPKSAENTATVKAPSLGAATAAELAKQSAPAQAPIVLTKPTAPPPVPAAAPIALAKPSFTPVAAAPKPTPAPIALAKPSFTPVAAAPKPTPAPIALAKPSAPTSSFKPTAAAAPKPSTSSSSSFKPSATSKK